MNKFLKLSLVSMLSAGAITFAACGQAKTENAAAPENAATTGNADAVAENPDEAVKITVSKKGFEPKTIGVKKGQAVKLAFIRTDEENCGNEIVFPKLDIRKDLPLNETVLVELTAPESGEIGFTCGMDMLRGKILVQ